MKKNDNFMLKKQIIKYLEQKQTASIHDIVINTGQVIHNIRKVLEELIFLGFLRKDNKQTDAYDLCLGRNYKKNQSCYSLVKYPQSDIDLFPKKIKYVASKVQDLIQERGEMSIPQISIELKISQHYAGQVLKKLEQKGKLVRVVKPQRTEEEVRRRVRTVGRKMSFFSVKC